MISLQRRGIISNGALAVTTFAASTANLDKSNDYYSAGNPAALQITGNLTLNAWIKPSAISGTQEIITKYDGGAGQRSYKYLLNGSGGLQVIISSNGTATQSHTTSNSIISSGVWSMVSMVYNGSTVEAFKNGVSQGSSSASGGVFNGTANVLCGSEAGVSLFGGGFAFPMIWDTDISAANLLTMYNSGISICYADLESHISGITTNLQYAPRLCNFNGNSGDELVDQSSNGITTTDNGTIPFNATGLTVSCT